MLIRVLRGTGFTLSLFLPVLLFAADDGHGAKASDPVIPQTVWAILSFLVVLFILWKKAIPPILGAMDSRAEKIREALAAADHGNVNAVIAENPLQLLDVGQVRHVFERQRVVGEKRRDHQRQSRVLRAGNRNGAVELIAPDDPDAIHEILARLLRLVGGARTHPVTGRNAGALWRCLDDTRSGGNSAERPRARRPVSVLGLPVLSRRCRQPFGFIGLARTTRPHLRLAALQVGTQLLGQPPRPRILAVVFLVLGHPFFFSPVIPGR